MNASGSPRGSFLGGLGGGAPQDTIGSVQQGARRRLAAQSSALGARALSADLALQGKRRVKQCLPLKCSSNICCKCHPDDLLQSVFFNCFAERCSFIALTPFLL